MDSIAAKEFLISKVIAEAEAEQVRLSAVERKMLHFSEAHPSLPDIDEVNVKFANECDSDEYEAKISDLLKKARDQDRKESSTLDKTWEEALNALKNEDHYILVMADQAFRPGTAGKNRLREFAIYIAIGLLVVLLMILKTMLDVKH